MGDGGEKRGILWKYSVIKNDLCCYARFIKIIKVREHLHAFLVYPVYIGRISTLKMRITSAEIIERKLKLKSVFVWRVLHVNAKGGNARSASHNHKSLRKTLVCWIVTWLGMPGIEGWRLRWWKLRSRDVADLLKIHSEPVTFRDSHE